MTTSPSTTATSPTSPDTSAERTAGPLRLALHDSGGHLHGAWWPRSRVLTTEAADLVDHFPEAEGRINRLLFSRPDWDDAMTDGQSRRRIRAARGMVKVGSFPSDDTHLMVLTMASGRRLRLVVVPSGTEQAEGDRRLRAVSEHGADDGADDGSSADSARWDEESPGSRP